MRTKLHSSTQILIAFSIILVLALPFLSVRPVFATRIFEDGFETGDLGKWSPIGGSPSITSGDAHHGTYKAVLDASGEYAQARFTFNAVDHCFMRAYVMFKSFPTTGTETAILGVYNWASSRYMSEARVVNVSGTVKWKLRYYHNGVHYTVVSEQQKPVLNTWYCVEVEGKSNTTTDTESRIYINGNELTDVSQTGKNNNLQITCAYIWVNNAAVTQWYDCVVVDSAYVGPEDMSPPVFGTTTANTTLVGTQCSLDCLVNDNVNVSTYIFSTNNTGAWTNDTAVVFSSFYNSTAAWANVTKTLNDTVGNVVSYMWYANDTSNNWSHSNQYNLTMTAIQRYLTVVSPYGTTGGQGWYNDGSTAYATLDTGIVDQGNGTHHVFTNWGGEASGTVFSQSDPITMDENKTAIAVWKTQYNVTFTHSGLDSSASGIVATVNGTSVNYDQLPYSFWADSDSIITYSYDNVSSTTTDKRFILTGITGAASPITVTGNATVTGNYKTQYYLTVSSVHDSPSPTSGWFNSGTNVTASVTSPSAGPTDTQYVCDGWTGTGSVQVSGAGSATTFTINEPSGIAWNWKTQYYLAVKTDPAGVTLILGEGWHNEASPVTLTSPAVQNYTFAYWDVDGSHQGNGTNPITTTMNAPHAATAHYVYVNPLTTHIQPTTATISFGQSVTLTSTVEGGTPPYTYRWYLNGNPVSGATSNSWVFTPSTAGIHYVYLQVTDSSNSTTQSETARIAVASVPVGGYSVSFDKQTAEKPLTLNFALVIGLALFLIAFKRKTRKTDS